MSKRIPKYVQYNTGCASAREFKQMKRRELRSVLKAMSDLQCGCAFFPNSSDDFDIAIKAVRAMQKDLSVKRWGN